MKKKNLVLTYSANQTELTSLTYPFLERYCENHNLDLLIMREPAQKIINKFEADGATTTHVAANNIFLKLVGITTLPTFAADVIA